MMYTVKGEPIPLVRPRTSFQKNKIYDSQKREKLAFGIEVARQHRNLPFFKGPLYMHIKFQYEWPKALKAKLEKQGKINSVSPIDYWKTSKADNSNLLKFVEDACEGILYEDDCTLVKHTIEKFYGPESLVTFTVENLTEQINVSW